jgi:signal transduction histidine kinase
MQNSENDVSKSKYGVEAFRQLSYELLKYSTKGLLRIDFLPKVSERIMKHANSDAVELWVKEGPDKHFRCVLTRKNKMPFGFILVPCPLGEEIIPKVSRQDEQGIEELCCDVINGSVGRWKRHMTERDSFWADDISGDTETDVTNKTKNSHAKQLQTIYKSLALIPIRLDEECIGLMQLKSHKRRFLSRNDLSFFEDISEVLGVALSHQYAQIELRERVKELTCMYGIAQVMAWPGAQFADVIQNIANLLPAAWLYPEVTCAHVSIYDKSYQTIGYKDSPYKQISDIVVGNEKIGFVEVAYLEKKITMDEGPFLKEERNLIDNVAREISIFCERAKVEEDKDLLQGQLRHADRLATIGQLAAGVAHELNEPLGNILGFAQLAKKSTDVPPQVDKDLSNIESASLHAREIIKKLMTFARQLPPKKAMVDLNEIIKESIFFFEGRCRRAGIELISKLTENLPKITVDPGQINQVLVNLVVNSIQAMPNGGALTVETRSDTTGVYFVVGDTGEGIDESQISSIFMPFFTTKDVNEGTGLGLAVVHGIVTAHGGKITVETKKNEGSNFIVHLPRR